MSWDKKENIDSVDMFGEYVEKNTNYRHIGQRIVEKTAEVISNIRRKPYPISDLIPHLSETSDAIEELRTENELLKKILFDKLCVEINMRCVARYGATLTPRQTGEEAREEIARLKEKYSQKKGGQ